MNECDEKESDPPEYHWTAPNALFPAACYNCCLCKGSRKKGKVIYRYDSLPLTILFRKADFQSVAFLTSQAGGGGITQKTFLIAFRLSPLSSPTNFFTALVLLSLNQDLRAIYLALFTVHCDCIFWQNNKVSSVFVYDQHLKNRMSVSLWEDAAGSVFSLNSCSLGCFLPLSFSRCRW